MEDMKVTLERVGKDKIDWFVSGKDMDKMLIDKETAIALQWQLMKEKMGIAFKEELKAIPQRVWSYAEVKEASAEVIDACREFENSKKLY